MDSQYSTAFAISKNLFMDIQKSGCILGYPLFIFGYPKIELWISSNQLIFGYPKMYLRISINRFLDIQNEFWVSINRE